MGMSAAVLFPRFNFLPARGTARNVYGGEGRFCTGVRALITTTFMRKECSALMKTKPAALAAESMSPTVVGEIHASLGAFKGELRFNFAFGRT